MKKIIFSCLFLVFSLLSISANAASLEDAKKNVMNGTGKIMLPNIENNGKKSREMTKEEATEYFEFIEKYQSEDKYPVDKYQSENDTHIATVEADFYIDYIAEKLDKSSNKEITDELRSEAEIYAKKESIKEYKKINLNSKKKTKETKKSFLGNLFSFNWFK